MRYLTITLLLYSLNTYAFTNEPNGFRGVNWGDPFENLATEMIIIEETPHLKLCTRKDSTMKIGNAELDEVKYFYQENKFIAAMMTTSGYDNKKYLIDAFINKFGRAEKPNRYIDEYRWRGNKSFIQIKCNSIKATCLAQILSIQGAKRSKEIDAINAKKAEQDF